MIKNSIAKVALIALPVSLWASARFYLPVDHDAVKQAEAAVRDAQQEGNTAGSMRAYRRWLEFFPNEPVVQAGIYRAMALISEQNGDADQAKVWSGLAANLDQDSVLKVAVGTPKTRGMADQLPALLGAVGQTIQAVQTARKSLVPQMLNPALNQPVPVPFQPQIFPQQPVGTPGSPIPIVNPAQPASTPQPIPIALDPQGNPIQQPLPPPQMIQPQVYQQPQPQPQMVQPQVYQQPQPQPQMTQPQVYQQPQPQPQMIQPQVYQQPQPQPQMMQPQVYQQPQPQYQPSGRPYYAMPRPPYAAPVGYARPQRAWRGDGDKPLRVFHDHSRLGDVNYFEPPCGALLVAEGGVLTITPTGGEGPLVIPASEILEIRMNLAVGQGSGAFHIVTRKGLYLLLAPEGATAEEGRADVDELRKQLGLDQ